MKNIDKLEFESISNKTNELIEEEANKSDKFAKYIAGLTEEFKYGCKFLLPMDGEYGAWKEAWKNEFEDVLSEQLPDFALTMAKMFVLGIKEGAREDENLNLRGFLSMKRQIEGLIKRPAKSKGLFGKLGGKGCPAEKAMEACKDDFKEKLEILKSRLDNPSEREDLEKFYNDLITIVNDNFERFQESILGKYEQIFRDNIPKIILEQYMARKR